MSNSQLLIIIAILLAGAAVMAVLFGVENAKVYPACIAASLAFGWAGLKF